MELLTAGQELMLTLAAELGSELAQGCEESERCLNLRYPQLHQTVLPWQ